MKPPEGHPDFNRKYWKLNKAIYGLKQSGREWNKEINKFLTKIGLRRMVSEPCIYVKNDKNKNILCIVGIYVDDILIAGKENEIKIIKEYFKRKYKIKEIGDVDFVIGIKFVKHKNGYFMHQRRYIIEVLEKFNMNNEKPLRNTKPITDDKLRNIKFNQTTYRSAIGNLLYIAICTRPDILFSVSKAARKSNNPNMEDWNNVVRILRYLKGTTSYGINYTRKLGIEAFVDADFAGDTETRRSTTGFLVTMGNAPTSWCSKLQHCVSTSTAESEYYSLSECGKHCIWYLNLMKELYYNIKCIKIKIDNKAAIFNSKNQSINPKTKHIDIRIHYIREIINKNFIKLEYIQSQNNLADGFTKYLNNTLMEKFRNSLLYKIEDLKF